MEFNQTDFFNEIESLGYGDIIVNKENKVFFKFMKSINIEPKDLTMEQFEMLWFQCFKIKLSAKYVRQKYKFFIQEKYNFKIQYVKQLPAINTLSTTILIKSSQKYKFYNNWLDFQNKIIHSTIMHYELKEKDFILDSNIDYINILEFLSLMDESKVRENCKKRIYILFFLFLTGENYALLPSSFIFSVDTFFSYITKLDKLTFFQSKHFFITKPNQSHLIDKEMNTNSKAKYIFYIRFSYLIYNSVDKLLEIRDKDILKIIYNMKSSNKSSKMVNTNENPLRRTLYWHGAINISPSKKEANKVILSPLELFAGLENVNIKLLDSFAKYFSSKPNNATYRKLSKYIADFLIYLNNKNFTYKELKQFFNATLIKKNEELIINSEFIDYLKANSSSATTQQDLQMIIYQVIESNDDFSGTFSKSNLVTLYQTPKNRRTARLAFDKKIINEMKKICLLNPPEDTYYIKTNINKSKMIWKHFDLIEPQLPVMLFLHLCMPWRSEHLISLDRDTFLIKDAKKNVIAWNITTDKNQTNNFVIDREFIDYAFYFKDDNEIDIDVMSLLDETIEYAKSSFPNLKPLLRKENKNWGKIKPILCKKMAIGFIDHDIYSGFYYKVLLKALYELGYSQEEIEYYVQISPKSKKFKEFPHHYKEIEKLSLNEVNKHFNSEYYNPHSLRKTNITHFVQDGKVFEFILKLSGHTAHSTVIQVYIDFNFLAKLDIDSTKQVNIIEKFNSKNTRSTSRDIIENYKKNHSINSNEIRETLFKKDLFFSPLVLSTNKKSIERNNEEDLEIISPVFWQDLSTGICTNGLNCPPLLGNRCSICPFFITGSMFFSAINAKIMQISTQISEFFKIIEENLINENLNCNEAEIYEEELQLLLAENQGYSAIVDKINKNIYSYMFSISDDEEKKNLPIQSDFSLIKYDHIPFYNAQLEIYQNSKKNFENNFSTKFSIEELYKKIMELILLEKLPKDLFINEISDKTKVIDTFIEHLEKNNLNNIFQQLLIKS